MKEQFDCRIDVLSASDLASDSIRDEFVPKIVAQISDHVTVNEIPRLQKFDDPVDVSMKFEDCCGHDDD